MSEDFTRAELEKITSGATVNYHEQHIARYALTLLAELTAARRVIEEAKEQQKHFVSLAMDAALNDYDKVVGK